MPYRGEDIIEQFRISLGVVGQDVDAVIDSGARTTCVPADVLRSIGAIPVGDGQVINADGRASQSRWFTVDVTWLDYVDQGYSAPLEVVEIPSGDVLIGIDFLRKFELSVDVHHGGLIGHAPPNSLPLFGGGWVTNVPRSYWRKMNYDRAQAAKPGKLYRPHPAFRFSTPAFTRNP